MGTCSAYIAMLCVSKVIRPGTRCSWADIGVESTAPTPSVSDSPGTRCRTSRSSPADTSTASDTITGKTDIKNMSRWAFLSCLCSCLL